MNAVLCCVRAWPGTQCDAGDEAGPKSLPKFPQPLEFAGWDPVACLDLEGEDPTLIVFDNEVHLVAIMGAPMTNGYGLFHPGDLCAQLVGHEGPLRRRHRVLKQCNYSLPPPTKPR